MTLDVRVRDLRVGDRLKYGRYGHRQVRVIRTSPAAPEWHGDKRKRMHVALIGHMTPAYAVTWNASTTIRVEREEPKADAKD